MSPQVSLWCESTQFVPITQVCPGVDFLVTARISCNSHVPITLSHSKLMLVSAAPAFPELN